MLRQFIVHTKLKMMLILSTYILVLLNWFAGPL
jgi:hypothetical protein